MSGELLIGNIAADHVSLKVSRPGPDGWIGAEIELQCDGWSGRVRSNFRKGELARFAEEVRRLHRDLVGVARLEPLEPNIVLTLTGDGKGHITVGGVGQNHFQRSTRLTFEFVIDQTYLPGIAHSLNEADPA